MRKISKNLTKARALVEPRPYVLADAVPLLQKAKYAKFDETVDLTMRLGVDPKHADQMVRGTVVSAARPGQDQDCCGHRLGRKDQGRPSSRSRVLRRRRAGRKDPERKLDRFRRRPHRNARHDEVGRSSW